MSFDLQSLRSLPESELIRLYDDMAKNTGVGINYYAEELDRRSRERATAANIELSRESQHLASETHALARRSFWLTVASAGLSFVAVVVAVIALLSGS